MTFAALPAGSASVALDASTGARVWRSDFAAAPAHLEWRDGVVFGLTSSWSARRPDAPGD